MDLMESMKKTMQIVENMTAYEELSDSPVLEPGSTEIWYVDSDKSERRNIRNFMLGWDRLTQYNKESPDEFPLPDSANLDNTHILLGKISETDPHRIYSLMQGENWSPKGEANNLIRGKGLGHTSMSVGDIIVINGNTMMVDDYGFVNIDTGEKVD